MNFMVSKAVCPMRHRPVRISVFERALEFIHTYGACMAFKPQSPVEYHILHRCNGKIKAEFHTVILVLLLYLLEIAVKAAGLINWPALPLFWITPPAGLWLRCEFCECVQEGHISVETARTPLRRACFAGEGESEECPTGKEEEERRVAEMGRPVLGEHTKLEVIIEESYEFKVSFPSRLSTFLSRNYFSDGNPLSC